MAGISQMARIVALAVALLSTVTFTAPTPNMHPSMPTSAKPSGPGMYKDRRGLSPEQLAKDAFADKPMKPVETVLLDAPEMVEDELHQTGDISVKVDLMATGAEREGDQMYALGETWRTAFDESEIRANTGHITINKEYMLGDHLPHPADITLSTQSDLDRFGAADLALEWDGPISYALLLTRDTEQQAKDMIKELRENNSAVKKHTTFHLCVADKKWDRYPINLMRNVAKRAVTSEYMLVIDIDETLGGNMAQHAIELKKAKQLTGGVDKGAYVVRSFEWQTRGAKPPSSFTQLKEEMEAGRIVPKHNYFAPAYNPDGFDLGKPETQGWLHSDEATVLPPIEFFEPYFIAKASAVPDFDTRFVGWGGNKNTLIHKMQLSNWKFVMLPRLFTFADETIEQTKAASAKKQVTPNSALTDTIFMRLAWEAGCTECNDMEKIHRCYSSCPKLSTSKVTAKLIQDHLEKAWPALHKKNALDFAQYEAIGAKPIKVLLQQPGDSSTPSESETEGTGVVEEVTGDGGVDKEPSDVLEKDEERSAMALNAIQAPVEEPVETVQSPKTAEEAKADEGKPEPVILPEDQTEGVATEDEREEEGCEEGEAQEITDDMNTNGVTKASRSLLLAQATAPAVAPSDTQVEMPEHVELVVMPGARNMAVPVAHVHDHQNAVDVTSAELEYMLSQPEIGSHPLKPRLDLDQHPEIHSGYGKGIKFDHKNTNGPHLSDMQSKTLNQHAVAALKELHSKNRARTNARN